MNLSFFLMVGMTLPGAVVVTLPVAARLAVTQSGEARVALAKRREIEALYVGASAPAAANPELSLVAGPGFVKAQEAPALEFLVTLTWPFEVSGAAARRQGWVAARDSEAQAELDDTLRRSAFAACDLYVRAHGALAQLDLGEKRVALDRELRRLTAVRRQAGTVGDGDTALAQILLAEGVATLAAARGTQKALGLTLAYRLGISTDAQLQLQPPAMDPPRPLETLLRDLSGRPDVRRMMLAERVAQADVTLQQRQGWPVPKASVAGGRGPEYQGELGLTLPLPVYQRNQTSTAVATAHAATALADAQRGAAMAAAEVRAAYAEFVSAAAAYDALMGAQPAVDDAEHLAVRAYELGQDSMPNVLVARRESIHARAALVDARIARDRAQLALAFVAAAAPFDLQGTSCD